MISFILSTNSLNLLKEVLNGSILMVENIPEEIVKDLQSVCQLHQQAVCNHDKCREFSESLSGLLVRLEDMKFYRMADRANEYSPEL